MARCFIGTDGPAITVNYRIQDKGYHKSKAEAGRLKKKFLTWRECEVVYSLQHRKILKLADEAGAIYRFEGIVLINRDIFDAFLEKFRQEPLTQG